MSWRLACALLVIAAVAMPAGEGQGAVRKQRSALRLPLPAPGHISLLYLERKVSPVRGRVPARLRLRPQRLRSLPPTVRVLYGQRRIKRGRSTTYRLVLVAVNVASARASAAQDAREPGDGSLFASPKGNKLTFYAELLLFFGSPVAADFVERHGGIDYGPDELYKASTTVVGAGNADQLEPSTLADLIDGLGKVVDPNGDGKPDPNLDTGHYDDGHAFGWSQTKAQQKTLAELTKANFDDYVGVIEQNLNEDVNGDGAVGGGGTQIDTQVGQPVITGGNP